MENPSERVKVVMRCRPLSKKEKTSKNSEIILINEKRNELIIKDIKKQKKPIIFTYDFVYSKTSKQAQIYNACSRPIIDFLLKGFNCTIFAYGQTGTGKTYTMEGTFENQGIIPRSFEQIFETINNAPENHEYLVRVSMLEIYNEELKDSLEPKLKGENCLKKLDINGSGEKGFFVKGLKQFNVKTVEELKKLLDFGKSTRQVRATAMNDFSSRSHSIFTIIIESSVTDENGNQTFKIGKLNMVDLAGSEKQKQTQTSDKGLKEGIKINLSLSNLVNVINLLVKNSSHIPYRNSKLTMLLADSLGGNSKTLMIANIGPSDSNYSETLQTLKYANRAKQIKNKPKINEDSKDALLRQKQDELKLLKLQIQQMGLESNKLSKNIDNLNLSYLKIENSASKKNKENFIDYKEKMEELKNEDESLKKEKVDLQKRLEEQREKLVREEEEKMKLIEKYHFMCNDFISKHDYEKDLKNAKEELDKLRNDKTHKKKFLQTKKLLEEKKEEVNKMNKNSKKVQEIINKISSQIILYREKINKIKQNQKSIKQNNCSKLKKLILKIESNRMILKKQLFFLQNLIPKNFVNLIENSNLQNSRNFCKKAYSINNLKKPISLNYYDLQSSYKNPYLRDVKMKKKKLDYPNDSEIYDDDFIDDSVVGNGFLNLKFFTGNDDKIYDAKSYVEEKFE